MSKVVKGSSLIGRLISFTHIIVIHSNDMWPKVEINGFEATNYIKLYNLPTSDAFGISSTICLRRIS